MTGPQCCKCNGSFAYSAWGWHFSSSDQYDTEWRLSRMFVTVNWFSSIFKLVNPVCRFVSVPNACLNIFCVIAIILTGLKQTLMQNKGHMQHHLVQVVLTTHGSSTSFKFLNLWVAPCLHSLKVLHYHYKGFQNSTAKLFFNFYLCFFISVSPFSILSPLKIDNLH